jgi:Holliday junction resolvase YEN1
MGIHGVFKEIASSSERVSLAKYSAAHLATHGRPLVIAIDIAIWLFQIQCGKGGSNPALRTLYYRLLRLLSLNIQPIFVFDGPNKPQWKRNKKVGGPGVRVVSVPEFLAKQLLKLFGFPIHIAPGEAEAECAVLQKAGIVDAVMSEDVDTLMFGSAVLLRNWTPEGSSKTPTHVTVYRAQDAKAQTGLDPNGMILVALMSGGDYVVEGIPGCGIKVACDAARAGFAHEMCKLAANKDVEGLQGWRERLQHEIRTNESKFFSRRNGSLVIPDDFPRMDVLGYYTHPCVSSATKLTRLKESLVWDQDIDFPALRLFAGEAFDWRCVSGAKKFIKNLAPAMLVRELRLRGNKELRLEPDAQQEYERELISAIHGERRHVTTDGELEYRVSFTPSSLVPIDLSIEEEDDAIAGNLESDSDIESGSHIATLGNSEVPASPTKSRQFRPYYPDQPEKLWVAKTFLQVGSPLLIEDHEAKLLLPKSAPSSKRTARGLGSRPTAKSSGKKTNRSLNDIPVNTMNAYAKVTKNVRPVTACLSDGSQLEPIDGQPQKVRNALPDKSHALERVAELPSSTIDGKKPVSSFRRPNIRARSQMNAMATPTDDYGHAPAVPLSRDDELESHRISTEGGGRPELEVQGTPRRRKRVMMVSPSPRQTQRTISSYYSPSPKKAASKAFSTDVVDLLSSSPARELPPDRSGSPSPIMPRTDVFRHERGEQAVSPVFVNAMKESRADCEKNTRERLSPSLILPAGVTPRSKRRKKLACRGKLTRASTAPVLGYDDESDGEDPGVENHSHEISYSSPHQSSVLRRRSAEQVQNEPIDLTSSPLPANPFSASPQERLASPSSFLRRRTPLRQEDMPATDSTVTQPKKKLIILRQSLVGTFKEVDVDAVDLSGDGSGWKASGGKASLRAVEGVSRARWRQSAVEILDLTGA